MTKYTFLLPAFKGRFLDEMLRSIQGQTYRDFKVIISDDCSPEDLRSICEPYLADPRFTYRRNAENMGSKNLVSHWNLLVDMCDTEFLILASDDDVYEPQFLEEIDKLTVKYPYVDLFSGRVRYIDGQGDLCRKDIPSEEFQTQLEFMYYYFSFGIGQCLAHYVFRTSVLKIEGGFYDLPLAWGSDEVTAIMLTGKGICHTQSICFSFRKSGINISDSGNLRTLNEKARAYIIKIRMLGHYIQKVGNVIDSKYDKNMYRTIQNAIRHDIHVNLFNSVEYSSYSEMIKYYKFLSQNKIFEGRLDKIHFLWTWVKGYKRRKDNEIQ